MTDSNSEIQPQTTPELSHPLRSLPPSLFTYPSLQQEITKRNSVLSRITHRKRNRSIHFVLLGQEFLGQESLGREFLGEAGKAKTKISEQGKREQERDRIDRSYACMHVCTYHGAKSYEYNIKWVGLDRWKSLIVRAGKKCTRTERFKLGR